MGIPRFGDLMMPRGRWRRLGSRLGAWRRLGCRPRFVSRQRLGYSSGLDLGQRLVSKRLIPGSFVDQRLILAGLHPIGLGVIWIGGLSDLARVRGLGTL